MLVVLKDSNAITYTGWNWVRKRLVHSHPFGFRNARSKEKRLRPLQFEWCRDLTGHSNDNKRCPLTNGSQKTKWGRNLQPECTFRNTQAKSKESTFNVRPPVAHLPSTFLWAPMSGGHFLPNWPRRLLYFSQSTENSQSNSPSTGIKNGSPLQSWSTGSLNSKEPFAYAPNQTGQSTPPMQITTGQNNNEIKIESSIVKVVNAQKSYGKGIQKKVVLDNLCLTVPKGSM